MSNESSSPDVPTEEPAEVPTQPAPAELGHGDPTGRTRLSGMWVGIIIGVVVLVVLLVFIIQNTMSVKVSFLTASGQMPLGVALLFAAVGGVLLTGVAASLRILQLRHRLHNSNRIESQAS